MFWNRIARAAVSVVRVGVLMGVGLTASAADLTAMRNEPVPPQIAEMREARHQLNWNDAKAHEFEVRTLDAAFVKVHFDYFKIPDGVTVEVSNPDRTEVYSYSNAHRDGFTFDQSAGQDGTTRFAAMSISGPVAKVRLTGRPIKRWTKAHGVRVSQVLEGYPEDLLEDFQQDGLLSTDRSKTICGTNQKLGAACYASTDPAAYDRSRPVARLILARGSNCTTWRIGPNNHMMTNRHCFRTQEEVAAAEIWFGYQSGACGGTASGTVTKVTGQTLLKVGATLDYTLYTINNFASVSSFGYLGIDAREAITGEQIYIPQHPGGRLKELAVKTDGGGNCVVDAAIQHGDGLNTDVGYKCDTEGGSSGSPVIARSSNKVISLHHLGGCNNGGLRMMLLWPDIASFWGNVPPNGDNGGTNPPPNVAPVASFSFVTSGLTATFTNTSTDSDGTIVSRSWNFGDGSTSTVTSPSKTYAAAGTYSVVLTVTDDKGATHSKTSSVTVTSTTTNNPPVANYTFVATGLSVVFTDTSTDVGGSIAARSWNFGDGTSSTLANPSKAYAAAGTYNVVLTVTDNQGATNTITKAVTVAIVSTTTYTSNTVFNINDNSTINSPIVVSGRTGNASSTTKVTVNITHTFPSDLKVDLVAPDGSLYTIHNRTSTGTQSIVKTVTVNASTELANGTWNLRVSDQVGGDIGKLNSWSLQF